MQPLSSALFVATALAAPLLQGCTTVTESRNIHGLAGSAAAGKTSSGAAALDPLEINRPPNAQSYGVVPKRNVVLLRVVVRVDGEPLEGLFSSVSSRHFSMLISTELNGKELVTLSNPGSATADARRNGWALLSLRPGSYELAFEPSSSQFVEWDSSVHRYAFPGHSPAWGLFRLEVSGAPLQYAGTLVLNCEKTAATPGTAYRCLSEHVLDEGDLAREVARSSLGRLDSLTTTLVVPETTTLAQSEPGPTICQAKPSADRLGQVLGVSVDLGPGNQTAAHDVKVDPAKPRKAFETRIVNCIGDAMYKVAPKLKPVPASVRLVGAEAQASSILETKAAMLTRLRESPERSELLSQGMRYLIAVDSVTGPWSGQTHASLETGGISFEDRRSVDTYVDVLIIDLKDGCFVDEASVTASSQSYKAVALVYFILPVPIFWPAGDTESEACRVVANHVAHQLGGVPLK